MLVSTLITSLHWLWQASKWVLSLLGLSSRQTSIKGPTTSRSSCVTGRLHFNAKSFTTTQSHNICRLLPLRRRVRHSASYKQLYTAQPQLTAKSRLYNDNSSDLFSRHLQAFWNECMWTSFSCFAVIVTMVYLIRLTDSSKRYSLAQSWWH